MTPPLLTQASIEAQILRLSDELESETERYADLAQLAAETEADWKQAHATTVVALASSDQRTSMDVRRATAELDNAHLLRVWLIAEARRATCRETLISLRARLDALRTLAANVRAQT